jgi:hypothetical protein
MTTETISRWSLAWSTLRRELRQRLRNAGITNVAVVMSFGNSAVVGPGSRRPVALRPRLSTGLPLSCWLSIAELSQDMQTDSRLRVRTGSQISAGAGLCPFGPQE